MSLKEENVCRLCLNVTESGFEVIDEITKDMFDVLLLKIDLESHKSPAVCLDCVDVVKKSYYFKLSCIDTEEYIRSSALDKDVKFELKTRIYEDSENIVVDKNFDMCRFCMNQFERNDYISLDTLMNDEMFTEMLPMFMPQMDINVTKNPVICVHCKDNLTCYFNFIKKCTETLTIKNEEKQIHYDVCNVSIKTEEDLDIKPDDLDLNNEYPEILSDIKTEFPRKRNESKKIKYKCELCNHETKRKHDFENHLLTHKSAAEVDMYTCELCAYQSRHKRNLKKHMLIHKDSSEVQTFKCVMCTYETKHKRWLKSHMVIHKGVSEVEMYKCVTCSYETKYKTSLKRHMKVHDDVKLETYKCSVCPYETKRKDYIKQHMLNYKDVSEGETYKCTMCNYEINIKHQLRAHMMVVHERDSEVELYKCVICTYETKYKNNLRYHVLTHRDISEVQFYKCAMCTYTTKYKNALRRHINLIHEDGKDMETYKCAMCPYESKRSSYLKNHVLVHKSADEVNMFKCTMCSFETKRKNSLNRHVASHRNKLEAK